MAELGASGTDILRLAPGSRMSELSDGEAALVLTGPPYFPASVEERLGQGTFAPAEVDALAQEIIGFAWGLRPVFEECWRITTDGGHLVMQTRDVRIRDRLVPVEAVHREIAEAIGYVLYTRHFWRPTHVTLARRRALAALATSHGPAPFDPEVFLVFAKPGSPRRGRPAPADVELLQQDTMRTDPGRLPSRHRFQSPLPVIRALVRSYSLPGDLVVDPFAGGGTIARIALTLGRRAFGYDIDPTALEIAHANLAGIPPTRGEGGR